MNTDPTKDGLQNPASSLLPFLSELRDAALVFDAEGRWLYGNPAFTDLTDCMAGPRGDVPWLAPESLERWQFFYDLHRSGRAAELGVGPVQVDILGAGGSRRRVAVLWDRVLGADGGVLVMLALVRPLAPSAADTHAELTLLLRVLTEAIDRIATPARPTPDAGEPGEGPVNGDHGATYAGELSAREREVLALLLAGRRVSTTARELYLSEHTVRNHLKRIYRKLGVHSLGELRELHVPVTTGVG